MSTSRVTRCGIASARGDRRGPTEAVAHQVELLDPHRVERLISASTVICVMLRSGGLPPGAVAATEARLVRQHDREVRRQSRQVLAVVGDRRRARPTAVQHHQDGPVPASLTLMVPSEVSTSRVVTAVSAAAFVVTVSRAPCLGRIVAWVFRAE